MFGDLIFDQLFAMASERQERVERTCLASLAALAIRRIRAEWV